MLYARLLGRFKSITLTFIDFRFINADVLSIECWLKCIVNRHVAVLTASLNTYAARTQPKIAKLFYLVCVCVLLCVRVFDGCSMESMLYGSLKICFYFFAYFFFDLRSDEITR